MARYSLEMLTVPGVAGMEEAQPSYPAQYEAWGAPPVPSPYIPPVIPPVIPGVETEDIAISLGVTNGVATTLGEEDIYAPPAAIPTIAPIAGALAAVMSLGVFKALLARFGPMLAKMLVGAAAFAGFMKLLGVGASDDVVLPIKPGEKKRKRYSIGANPRVGTLSKVSRHCMRMLKRHRKVIDEFLPPKRRALPATALARTYLSTAERKALKA